MARSSQPSSLEQMPSNSSDADFLQQMKSFPCTFNLECQKEIPWSRRKYIEKKLLMELETEEDSEEEKIRKKNLLTWIYFQEDKEKALELNTEIVEKTESRNMTALGNRVYILWNLGYELEAEQCLIKMASMQKEILAEAKAEQADFHRKIGGPFHSEKAIDLFTEALETVPDNPLWIYRLGLVYRRMTHSNIFCSTSSDMNVISIIQKAVECLSQVCDNEKAVKQLQSMAYAQLVSLRQYYLETYDAMFKNQNIYSLCRKALKHGRTNPRVLAQCGRSFHKIEVDKAISLLEKSVKLQENSLAYHHLGVAYINKAAATAQDKHTQDHNCNQFYSEIGAPKLDLAKYVHGCIQQVPLNKDDDLVKKGIDAIKKSIHISNDENNPAILELGLVFKMCGQTEEALKQFNKVTHSTKAMSDHIVTFIDALEEAGLCYLELAKKSTSPNNYKELVKKKLLMAIKLQLQLAEKKPEFKGIEQEIWTTCKILKEELANEQPSKNVFNERIRLLELIKADDEILQLFEEWSQISDEELTDKSLIETRLRSLVNTKKYEEALVQLTFLKKRHKEIGFFDNEPLSSLQMKILLLAASGRLESGEVYQHLFQQMFALKFGRCSGVDHVSSSEEEDDTPEASDQSKDVLLVFDEDVMSDPGQGLATRVARNVKLACLHLFGLDAEENLQGCFKKEDFSLTEVERQLKEMLKYQVVILVLDNDRSRELNSVLDSLPYLPSTNTPPRILFLNTCTKSSDVTLSLSGFRSIETQDIGDLGENSSCLKKNFTNNDIVEQIFHRDIHVVMRLFCFITDTVWPCL